MTIADLKLFYRIFVKRKKKQKQHVTRVADTKINEIEHKSHI